MLVRLAGAGRRVGIAALLLLAVLYPVRAWFGLPRLPWVVKAAWVLALLLAWWRPHVSLLAFLAGAPLLAVVPALEHWPTVSLASAWLWALLIPAWIATLRRPDLSGLPRTAAVFVFLATASLLAGLYPLHLARDGPRELWLEIDDYLLERLVVATSQRPVLSPLLAWLTLAQGMGLLWLVCCLARSTGRAREWLERAAVASAMGAGAVGVWAVDQWRTGEHLLQFWVEQDPYITRVNASFTDVNALGAYLASMIALMVAVAMMRSEAWWRGTWLAAAACAGLGVVFAASRIAWLAGALALAGFVAGALYWRLGTWSERRLRRLRMAATATAVAAVVSLSGLTLWATARNARYLEQRSYLDTLLYTVNLRAPLEERLKGRGRLWRAAVDIMRGRPLTGIGLGRYYKDLAAWVPNPDALGRPQENAHNYFLQIGAELGVPGVLCLAWVFGLAVARGLRIAHGDESIPARRIGLAAAAGVVAFGLTQLTGHSLLLHEGQLTFWGLAGLPIAFGLPGAGVRRVHAAMTADVPASHGLGGRLARWLVPVTLLVIVATLPWRMGIEAARVDLARLTMGLYDEESTPSGVAFNWMSGRARFHVPVTARVVSFDVRRIAPFSQTLQIRHDGQLIQQIVLSDGNWHPVRYVLPTTGKREGYRRFDLLVSPTWTPPDDERELGVMVAAIHWVY